MSAAALLAALRTRIAEGFRTWAPGARGAWCRKQRRALQSSAGTVLWLRGPPVTWAEWGARRGYFAVDYMDGLAYLKAAALPAVWIPPQ